MTSALEGRHIVVTGAGGGLGATVVEVLSAAGAICHLPLRGPIPPPNGAAPPRIHPVGGVDLSSEAAVAGFYAALPPLWASVHVAGGFAAGPIAETTLASLRGQLDINLTTAFLCSREAVRNMRGQPGPDRGRIVNVSSRAALVPAGGSIAYSTAKAAVNMLTQALAEEVKGDGILVNAVAPSIIDTPANRAAMPAADHDRWPKPADIARTIGWLASPENRLTTGAIVPVYGTG